MYIGVCASASDLKGLEVPHLVFLEGNVQGYLVPRSDEAAFSAELQASRDSRLPMTAANCFIPGDLKTTGPDVDAAALDQYVQTALVRAQRAAVCRIVFGSGASRAVPEGWEKERAFGQLADFLKRIAPWAQQHGVTICVEPLNSGECNMLNTIAEGVRLVRAVDHPAVRLLADFYHMARQGEGPESLRPAEGLLAHVHVAEKQDRTAPGVKGDDFRPYLRVLRDIGYQGDISIECGWQDFRAQVGPAVQELRQQIDWTLCERYL